MISSAQDGRKDTARTVLTDESGGSAQFEEEVEGCSRRLSRAARVLVHKHLVQIIRAEAEQSILYEDFLDQSNVWVLLEYWLHSNGRRLDQCPLNPSLDVHRVDEEHSLEVEAPFITVGAYPTFVTDQRPKGKRKRRWFECGYNGKLFTSRFYLDLHLDKHQESLLRMVVPGILYCPAIDWCKTVGLANCHATALQEEPYYGRGGDGWGADGYLVRHKWVKKAQSIPCSVAKMREECHSAMRLCGIADSWCDSLVCPTHRIQDSLSPSEWNNDLETSFHARAFLVAVVILFVCSCLCYSILDVEDAPFGPSYAISRPRSNSKSKKMM